MSNKIKKIYKIVITQDLGLSKEQIKRLKKIGKVKIYNNLAKNDKEWLNRCKDADIVCSGKFGMKTKIYELKDVFFSLPFVGVGFLDTKRLKEKNITVSYCPGCNKDAVSEWIIGMMINLLRNFPLLINNKILPKGKIPKANFGLTGKSVTILGKGNIGSRVGKICAAFDMDVIYFRRGDDLIKCARDADVLINVLSLNATSIGILNNKFFNSLKKGVFFVSVTSSEIFDTDAMIKALDDGKLAGVACDAGGIQVGNVYDTYYKKLSCHPKILITPHIAYNTDVTNHMGNNIMIDNIEAWIKDQPINLVK